GSSASSTSTPERRSKNWVYQPIEPQYLFASSEPASLLTEVDIRNIVSAAVEQNATTESVTKTASPEDALQDKRLSELDKALKAFQSKAGAKTYPNITVNGVFQADAGWIRQDSVSESQYGNIQDGSDFRRARLSAKGGVTETTNYMFQMDFGFFGRPTFTDVWLEQTKVPFFGNVRIGQWKQPFGLEVASSFRTRRSWNEVCCFSRSHHFATSVLDSTIIPTI
ncbi:MAG: porin, partial [Planctomycetota bacterium]|nr:porin [Planctomycetota bacterium]